MPTMYEIYDNHACEYDELVTFEDYKGNLKSTLNNHFDFNGKTVIELGTGTGRVTAMYVDRVAKVFCYDRAQHMLSKAEKNLSAYIDKISFGVCDNNSIDSIKEKSDFVIEGWSFGHTVSDHLENAESKIDEMVNNSSSLLNDEGTMIFIETLGTNAETAAAPAPFLDLFYTRLKSVHGFKELIIETDYQFDSVDEAARISGFFFGPEIADDIRKKGTPTIKEFTGLWYKQK